MQQVIITLDEWHVPYETETKYMSKDDINGGDFKIIKSLMFR